MPHVIIWKKNNPENLFIFSLYKNKRGVFRVTFLEFRVIGYAFCFFTNRIDNVPWQQSGIPFVRVAGAVKKDESLPMSANRS